MQNRKTLLYILETLHITIRCDGTYLDAVVLISITESANDLGGTKDFSGCVVSRVGLGSDLVEGFADNIMTSMYDLILES